MAYYNTTNEKGKYLTTITNTNIAKDAKVLAVMREKKIPMTPYDILHELLNIDIDGAHDIIIVRRALSDWSAEKGGFKLVKMGKKKVEIKGRPNHYWRLKD